jgi:hypothetical protein
MLSDSKLLFIFLISNSFVLEYPYEHYLSLLNPLSQWVILNL